MVDIEIFQYLNQFIEYKYKGEIKLGYVLTEGATTLEVRTTNGSKIKIEFDDVVAILKRTGKVKNEIDAEESYYCTKCKKNHRTSSKIGSKHLNYKKNSK